MSVAGMAVTSQEEPPNRIRDNYKSVVVGDESYVHVSSDSDKDDDCDCEEWELVVVNDDNNNGNSIRHDEPEAMHSTHCQEDCHHEEDQNKGKPPTLSPHAPQCQTFGTMGKAQQILHVGHEAVLLEYHATPKNSSDTKFFSCVMTHFWFGGAFPGVEETRIRYYIDGEMTASIDFQLYLGHGMGLFGDDATTDCSPWMTKFMGKTGTQNGIHNHYRIPFSRSIRVTAELGPTSCTWWKNPKPKQEDETPPMVWWILRGLSNAPKGVTLGGMDLPYGARLRLAKVEQYTAQPLEEVVLCHIPSGSAGALFQVTVAAQSTNSSLSFMEGCVRAYLNLQDDSRSNYTTSTNDDANNETLLMLSSGLEDYFLGTYYFKTGLYHADSAGLTHLDRTKASFSAYRFHDQDPIFFTNGLRLTCRCGETAHGTADGKASLNPQPTTYTTYVWYYQW